MSKYFIGVDTSTTASKALAINEQGNVIVVKGNPHELSTPRPLWSEQDPEDWWQAATQTLVLPAFGTFTAGVPIRPAPEDTLHAIYGDRIISIPTTLCSPFPPRRRPI